MRWSAIARGSFAAMLLSVMLPAAAVRAQLADFCPVPGMTMAPFYPLRLTGLGELALIRQLPSATVWHAATVTTVPRSTADESTARYEDGTPQTLREPAIYAYQQPLPLVLALFRETLGGRLVTHFADELAELTAAYEDATDDKFVFAPQVPCGMIAGEHGLAALEVSLPRELTIAADYPELADDLRHSLGNDDVLLINGRENGIRVRKSRHDDFVAAGLINPSPWGTSRYQVFEGCGGLGVPVTVAMQPAPAAAIDLSDLTAPRNVGSQDEVARLAQPGMKQLLGVVGAILHHFGSGLIDVAHVLSPEQNEQESVTEQSDIEGQRASMPSDLHLGL